MKYTHTNKLGQMGHIVPSKRDIMILTKYGKTINADVNGATNILRKSKQNFDFEELCKGLLASPSRIRVV